MQPTRPKPICFKGIEQVCIEYEKKCKLSSLCFYPTGGLLYHLYADICKFKLPMDLDCVTKKSMFNTPDIDGYFMIVPKNLDLTHIRQTDAYKTHKIALEVIEEALTKYDQNNPIHPILEMLEFDIKYLIENVDNDELNHPLVFYDMIRNPITTRMCDLDVHLNVVRKPLNFKRTTYEPEGFFLDTEGTELVLNKWTSLEGYNHVFIVEPIVHLFDQLATLYNRKIGSTRLLKQIKKDEKLSNFHKRKVKTNFKTQKTAFRIKIFSNAVFPNLTIKQLFEKMKNRHFEGALDIFEKYYQKESKMEQQNTNFHFLDVYGDKTIQQFCDDVLNQIHPFCNKLRNIYIAKLKF